MHAYFGSACFVFHSIERDNERLAIFLSFMCHWWHLSCTSFFFQAEKSWSILHSSCWYHPVPLISLVFLQGLERYWEAKWHCRAILKLGLQISLKDRLSYNADCFWSHTLVPQTTSASAGSGHSRFPLRWLLALHFPTKTHEASKVQEEWRGVKWDYIHFSAEY